jgi:hypothetical protein
MMPDKSFGKFARHEKRDASGLDLGGSTDETGLPSTANYANAGGRR